MDESTTTPSAVSKLSGYQQDDARISFGMDSFEQSQRREFGEHVRLAMACMEASSQPVNTMAVPREEGEIRRRLKALSQDFTSQHADLLELLVRFDELEGWKASGAKHCAGWANLEIGISLKLGWEYLRVGRKLRLLPTTTALFRAGKLSWSKIRLLASVADPDNEKTLCHTALDASVSDVKRVCSEYRWSKNQTDNSENELAIRRWESRKLTWDKTSNGSTRIQLILPPETAQAFLASIDYSMNQILDTNSQAGVRTDCTLSQRRADAAVLMAETNLQASGVNIATADRYQVIVSVDAAELSKPATDAVQTINTNLTMQDKTPIDKPTANTTRKKPTLRSAGPIAAETARRIACDCHVTINTTSNGEPTDIGRKSRLWPNAMARAIKERDQHCQFYGCTQATNLQIHHLTHWADGGTTSIANGVCLCQKHHTFVHEGGYSIQRVDDNEERLKEQFNQQTNHKDLGMFPAEKSIRSDQDSFRQVRKLLPTRHRFRVLDAQGRDIRFMETTTDSISSPLMYPVKPEHSIRIECRENTVGDYRHSPTDCQAPAIAPDNVSINALVPGAIATPIPTAIPIIRQ